MVFRWLKDRRRRKLLAEPVPSDWREIVLENVRLSRALGADELPRLLDLSRVFVAEKNWEGCGSQVITDEVKLTIAAQASLMIMRRPDLDFDHVLTILVYPRGFVAPRHTEIGGGLTIVGDEARAGEAWHRGPGILSWDEALAGTRGETDGSNLILHEFAHQLDMRKGGVADGTPPMRRGEELRRWREVLTRGMRQLEIDCRRDRPGALDCYGLESPAEFFAVATEAVFELPEELQWEQPALFAFLSEYYRLLPPSTAA